jgi:hypothetical protein
VGSKGRAPGEFDRLCAVSVVPSRATGSGEAWLVVTDTSNRHMRVLTRTGTVVRVLQGDAVVQLSTSLHGVTVCLGTGEALVMDYFNHRVVSWRLSDGGGLRVVCGGFEGSGPGQLASGRGGVWRWCFVGSGRGRFSIEPLSLDSLAVSSTAALILLPALCGVAHSIRRTGFRSRNTTATSICMRMLPVLVILVLHTTSISS